jgi:hypothetical protein
MWWNLGFCVIEYAKLKLCRTQQSMKRTTPSCAYNSQVVDHSIFITSDLNFIVSLFSPQQIPQRTYYTKTAWNVLSIIHSTSTHRRCTSHCRKRFSRTSELSQRFLLPRLHKWDGSRWTLWEEVQKVDSRCAILLSIIHPTSIHRRCTSHLSHQHL